MDTAVNVTTLAQRSPSGVVANEATPQSATRVGEDGELYRPHVNGGGLVALTAWADPSVFVGPRAMVRDRAIVLGDVRVLDESVIEGNAHVVGNATLRHHARVGGSATLMGWVVVVNHAVVQGDALLADRVLVEGYAFIDESTRITGELRVC